MTPAVYASDKEIWILSSPSTDVFRAADILRCTLQQRYGLQHSKTTKWEYSKFLPTLTWKRHFLWISVKVSASAASNLELIAAKDEIRLEIDALGFGGRCPNMEMKLKNHKPTIQFFWGYHQLKCQSNTSKTQQKTISSFDWESSISSHMNWEVHQDPFPAVPTSAAIWHSHPQHPLHHLTWWGPHHLPILRLTVHHWVY